MKRKKSRRLSRQAKVAIEGLIVTAIGFSVATQLQGPYHLLAVSGCVIVIGYLLMLIAAESVTVIRNLRHLRGLLRQQKGDRHDG